MAYYSVHRSNGSNELYHYGILGQKWGVRRYQNEDGTYTSEGAARRKRFGDGSGPFQMFKNQIARTKNYYKLQRSKPIVIKKDEKPLSELQRKHGFSKGAYGSINKTVNGVRYGINNDSDINTVNSILKDKNYFKSSPIEKEMKNQVSFWADAQGDKIKSFPKLKSVYAAGGTAEASYWYDGDDDILGGHSVDIEFDPKTKKVINISTNG